MVRFSRSAFFLLANLTLLSPASAGGLAGGAPEVTLSWRLEFGGHEIHTGYAAALGVRAPGPDGLAGELFSLDVSDRSALARLAGVPLMARSYRVEQSDLDAPEDAPARRPWYGRQWVWWTVGGMAATAALGSGGGEVFDDERCTGDCGNGGVSVVSGDVVGPNELCTMSGTEAETCVEGGLVAASSRAVLAEPHAAGLDAGTGGMGDLLAR